jgi:hypothetical protein
MANRSDPLGYDLDVGPRASGRVDLYRDARACSGVQLARNEIVSRLMSDTIKMIGAPGGVIDWGYDVRADIGSPGGPNQTRIALVIGRSKRILTGSIRVDVQRQATGAHHAYTVKIDARTVNGEDVNLLLGITDATVERIAAG